MSKLNHYTIVYVDDEALALKYFERGFSKEFNVLTASSAAEGWALIEQRHAEIGVLMSDQRMPGQTGVELLERVRHHYPQIIRILVTAYSDVESAIAGVNAGAIYRYISKPWDVPDLRVTLLRALQFFELLKERDQLLGEKLSILQQIVLSDRTKNLGVLAAGLQSRFRNALNAAADFVAAVPQTAVEPFAPESGQIAIGKNIEHQITQSSKHVARVASAMAELSIDSARDFSGSPQPLASMLGALDRNPGLPASTVISLKLNPSLPALKAEPKHILKLFTMLVSNLAAIAQKTSPITIEARETIREGENEFIRIVLSDGGPDWTPEQRVRMFAPFSSTKDPTEPLGLDLTVCFFIVHHHGGRIAVGGKQDAKITIHLPVDPIKATGGSLDSSLVERLFRYERTFEDFLTRTK